MKKNNCEKWLKTSTAAKNVVGIVMLGVSCAMGIIYSPYKITITAISVVYLLCLLLNNVLKKRCAAMEG